MRRILVAWVLLFVPPFNRFTLGALGLIVGLVAAGAAAVWYIDIRFPGHGSTNSQIRWMAYICLSLIFLAGLFSPSASSHAKGVALFRSGAEEQSAVIGDRFGIQRGNRWTLVRLDAIVRVRRLFGIAALQLRSGKYWLVPKEVFLPEANWQQVKLSIADHQSVVE